jgi:uncharacterized protein YhbP (UPF0306 family)
LGLAALLITLIGAVSTGTWKTVAFAQGLQTKAEAQEVFETKEDHESDQIVTNNAIEQLEESDKLYIEAQNRMAEKIDKANERSLESVTIMREIRNRIR